MISLLTNFNPRSHEGSDKISQPTITKYCLFQSTLPRGERPCLSCLMIAGLYFNPRSHEGSDKKAHIGDIGLVISIHAPTRGATYISKKVGYGIAISIHAPTRGATKCGKIRGCTMGFQSTLPRGERPLSRQLHPCPRDFNPRSHEGSDQYCNR